MSRLPPMSGAAVEARAVMRNFIHRGSRSPLPGHVLAPVCPVGEIGGDSSQVAFSITHEGSAFKPGKSTAAPAKSSEVALPQLAEPRSHAGGLVAPPGFTTTVRCGSRVTRASHQRSTVCTELSNCTVSRVLAASRSSRALRRTCVTTRPVSTVNTTSTTGRTTPIMRCAEAVRRLDNLCESGLFMAYRIEGVGVARARTVNTCVNVRRMRPSVVVVTKFSPDSASTAVFGHLGAALFVVVAPTPISSV